MPSAKVLKEKKQVVSDIIERLKSSAAGVFVDYCGLTVEEDTDLRNKMREAGVEYTVIKNTMLRFAINELDMQELDPILNGPTALATSETDLVAAAKVIANFAKDNENMQVKAGFVEGNILKPEEVDKLAKLPSKEELVAMSLRGLQAPIAGFANVLNANLTGLVRALNAVAQQKAA